MAFCVKTTQITQKQTKENKRRIFFLSRVVLCSIIIYYSLLWTYVHYRDANLWAGRFGCTAEWNVYTTMEDNVPGAAGWCHSRWTNEGESSTEELWWCHRAGIINAAFCWWFETKKNKKNKHYKVTALSIMSKRKIIFFSPSYFFPPLHFQFLQHPKRKQLREVRNRLIQAVKQTSPSVSKIDK